MKLYLSKSIYSYWTDVGLAASLGKLFPASSSEGIGQDEAPSDGSANLPRFTYSVGSGVTQENTPFGKILVYSVGFHAYNVDHDQAALDSDAIRKAYEDSHGKTPAVESQESSGVFSINQVRYVSDDIVSGHGGVWRGYVLLEFTVTVKN